MSVSLTVLPGRYDKGGEGGGDVELKAATWGGG